MNSELIASALKHPAVNAIHFTLNGNSYTSAYVNQVADKLLSGAITVSNEKKAGVLAAYELKTTLESSDITELFAALHTVPYYHERFSLRFLTDGI